MVTDVLSFDEARARLLSDVDRLSVERVSLLAAAGRVLAADLAAGDPLPRFDHSSMDGYAVATSEFEGSGPWTFRVTGLGGAGTAPDSLPVGSAARIFTGAPLPHRADAVVMQERAARAGQDVCFDSKPDRGQHVRHAGEDLARGAVAIEGGTRLGAGSLALAAMLGRVELSVARRPRVTILATGDELCGPGEALGPATIHESNAPALAALALQAAATPRLAPLVRDDAGAMKRAVEEALEGTDLLLTVGGVSVGDHDLVRPALERAGVVLDFWKVAMKPGKPVAVGRAGGRHVLALPGNPASAIVTFALFGIPLLRALQGDRTPCAMAIPARANAPRVRAADRVEFVRAVLRTQDGALVAFANDNQASGAATSVARSDGLMVVPAGDHPLAAGSPVEFLRWADA
ncbi:MAG: gephyrin-like molybdotransferase Glp [Polyangiaceae bacterium]|jgi:molybdopterin molybdotransferase